MLSKITGYGLDGLEGFPIHVEVDYAKGLPSFELVGLPDTAVKESKERVRAAIVNSGKRFVSARIVVNLAPADVKKEGASLDLAVARSAISLRPSRRCSRRSTILFFSASFPWTAA